MKHIAYISLMVVLVSTCGSQDQKKNKDLREQNEALEAQNRTNEEAAKTSAKKAEDAAARAREAEEKNRTVESLIAEAKHSKELETARAEAEAKRAEVEAKRAAEAEAQKIAAQKALEAELAKPHENIALRPYSGVWIAEQSVAGLAGNCGILTVVSSKTETITRAVVCGDDGIKSLIQLEVFSPSDFGARIDLFPNSLGLSVSGTLKSSTCGLRDSLVAPAKEFVFDQSTRAAATPATYMFTTIGDGSKTIVSASGASSPEFERQQSCESIQKLAGRPTFANKTLVQVAALICKGTAEATMTSGCFTAAGFVQATSR